MSAPTMTPATSEMNSDAPDEDIPLLMTDAV